MLSEYRLTPKKSRFVTAFLDHGDPYQAGIDAGYSEKLAANIHNTILQEIPVQQALLAAENEEFGEDFNDINDFYLDSGLTPQLARFAVECSQEDNMKQAARNAGFTEEYLDDICKEALQNPLFHQAVKIHTDAQIKRLSLTKDRIISELMKLAFSNLKNVIGVNGEVIPFKDLDEDVTAAISEISVTEWKERGVVVGEIKKIKISDKQKALMALAQLTGMGLEGGGSSDDDDDKPDVTDTEILAKAIAFASAAARRQ